MTEQARRVVEAIKQAYYVFDKMELPVEEKECTISYDAGMALIGEIERLERERDAAIEDMKSVLGTGLCFLCQNRYLPDGAHRYACKELGEFREDHNPTFCGMFEWRGVPGVKEVCLKR